MKKELYDNYLLSKYLSLTIEQINKIESFEREINLKLIIENIKYNR